MALLITLHSEPHHY